MIRVLHIGSEKQWRGGENQISLLAKNSSENEFVHHIAYPKKSHAFPVFKKSFYVCPLSSTKSYDFRVWRQLIKYCQEFHIQVLDAHSSVALGWALKVKKQLPHLRIVFHRRVAFPIKNNKWSREKYFSKDIDAYVGISSFITKQLIDYGIPEEKVHLVRSAVNADTRFQHALENQKWKDSLGLDDKAILIGLVGAITWEKGHDLAIEAFSGLREPNAHLILAGEGKLREEIEQKVNALQMQKNVHFLGHIMNTRSLLSGLDILLAPSRQEGLGTTVLDAIMEGCLVVASNAGGLPEMIQDEKTGFSFESGNADQLEQSLKQALAAFSSGHIQENAKKLVEDRFSLMSMVKGNEAIYKSIMHESPK